MTEYTRIASVLQLEFRLSFWFKIKSWTRKATLINNRMKILTWATCKSFGSICSVWNPLTSKMHPESADVTGNHPFTVIITTSALAMHSPLFLPPCWNVHSIFDQFAMVKNLKSKFGEVFSSLNDATGCLGLRYSRLSSKLLCWLPYTTYHVVLYWPLQLALPVARTLSIKFWNVWHVHK